MPVIGVPDLVAGLGRRPRRRSGAGRAPPASAAGWSASGRRTAAAASSAASSSAVSTSKPRPVALDLEVVDARAAGPGPSGGCSSSACDRGPGQVAQVGQRARSRRCGPARMMLTRSHSRSTSARMWLDSSTVRPLSRNSSTHSWKTDSMIGSSPDVGSSRTQQLDVRGQRRDQGDLLPVALGVAAALLGGVELEALDQLARGAARRGRRAAGRAGR